MAAVIGNNLKDAVNLTPHDIVIVGDDGKEVLRIVASGKVGRMISGEREMAKISIGNDIFVPVVLPVDGSAHDHYVKYECDGAENEKNIIVSKMVADAIWETAGSDDTIWVPDTGPDSVVRDVRGAIIGVKRVLLYTKPQ